MATNNLKKYLNEFTIAGAIYIAGAGIGALTGGTSGAIAGLVFSTLPSAFVVTGSSFYRKHQNNQRQFKRGEVELLDHVMNDLQNVQAKEVPVGEIEHIVKANSAELTNGSISKQYRQGSHHEANWVIDAAKKSQTPNKIDVDGFRRALEIERNNIQPRQLA